MGVFPTFSTTFNNLISKSLPKNHTFPLHIMLFRDHKLQLRNTYHLYSHDGGNILYENN